MWSWQQHHGLCEAGFQRRSALADAPTHVELATAPRIMRRFQRRSVLADVPHMWSWLHEFLAICSPTRSSDWQCSGLHYTHLSLFIPV
jgi:hypothetical protein